MLPDSPRRTAPRDLGDFSVSSELVWHTTVAALVGAVVTGVALGLLNLIGLITHLAYTGTWGVSLTSPDPRVLGPASVLVPIGGGLVIGLMARFGSERIRGHGIPEAMETILLRGSKMEPRLAVLKPISSAVSIGTGGPFGAEGPIIVTGGAVGSLVGQHLHLTAVQRRGLLVAGAAAGMTAVFGTPVAAVLLSVELLLFEWRPRSLVPVAAAALAAQMLRDELADAGLIHAVPLFPVPAVGAVSAGTVAVALGIGLACAGLAWAMTRLVYACEDLFARLPVHWAWWPALGGVVVGVGGLIDPRVLGAGYATIGQELDGRLALGALAALLVVKLIVWSIALGSNTSGGILAPLLMMGAAIGGIAGHLVPGADVSTFALLGMAAAMAGVMRSPLTSVIFALELTHAINVLPALLAASMVAHLASVLALRRSILTEKIARRGHHVNREYEVDPMQTLLVRDVMTTDVITIDPTATTGELYDELPEGSPGRRQRLLPVLGAGGELLGVVAWSQVLEARHIGDDEQTAAMLAQLPRVVGASETLRGAADLMVASGHGALPVVDGADPARLVGLITQFDLLAGHARTLVEERHRERPLTTLTLGRRLLRGNRRSDRQEQPEPAAVR